MRNKSISPLNIFSLLTIFFFSINMVSASFEDYTNVFNISFDYSGTSTLYDFPVLINGSNGFEIDGNINYVWTTSNLDGENYLVYDVFSNYSVFNSTFDLVNMEVADGNGTSLNSEKMWKEKGAVLILHGENDYNDSTGISNGTIVDGGGWFSTDGIIGKGIMQNDTEGDGSAGSRLKFSNEAFNFSENDEFSVSFWVNWNGLGNTYQRIITQSYEIDSFDIFIAPDGTLLLSGGDWDAYLTLADAVQVGNWTHFINTRNTTSSRIYLNGVLKNETTGSYIVEAYPTATPFINIGGCGLDAVCYRMFNGTLDEVYVFNRSLSPDEVTALYESQTIGTISELDPFSPYFIDGTPLNQNLDYGESLDYDINATDNIELDSFTIDLDTIFEIDSDGIITNITRLNENTIYVIEVTINDTSNNVNSTFFNVSVGERPIIEGEIYQEEFSNLISCQGNFTTPCTNAYDGDYDTYTRFVSGSYYVNYSIPDYTQSAKLQVRFGNNLTNFTIPSDCLEYDSLILKFDATESGEYSAMQIKCTKTGGDISIYSIDEGGYKYHNYLYEEAVFWYVDVPPSPVTESVIYRLFEDSGSGLASFTLYISRPLIEIFGVILIIGVLVAVIFSLVTTILRHFTYQIQNKTFK